jgi:hypothetical protein
MPAAIRPSAICWTWKAHLKRAVALRPLLIWLARRVHLLASMSLVYRLGFGWLALGVVCGYAACGPVDDDLPTAGELLTRASSSRLQVLVGSSCDSGKVISVDMETYVARCTACESKASPPVWYAETQAVLCRTYAQWHRQHRGKLKRRAMGLGKGATPCAHLTGDPKSQTFAVSRGEMNSGTANPSTRPKDLHCVRDASYKKAWNHYAMPWSDSISTGTLNTRGMIIGHTRGGSCQAKRETPFDHKARSGDLRGWVQGDRRGKNTNGWREVLKDVFPSLDPCRLPYASAAARPSEMDESETPSHSPTGGATESTWSDNPSAETESGPPTHELNPSVPVSPAAAAPGPEVTSQPACTTCREGTLCGCWRAGTPAGSNSDHSGDGDGEYGEDSDGDEDEGGREEEGYCEILGPCANVTTQQSPQSVVVATTTHSNPSATRGRSPYIAPAPNRSGAAQSSSYSASRPAPGTTRTSGLDTANSSDARNTPAQMSSAASELCNGVDDDSDPRSPDGQDDPQLFEACTLDSARDQASSGPRLVAAGASGVLVCRDGALVCVDRSGSRSSPSSTTALNGSGTSGGSVFGACALPESPAHSGRSVGSDWAWLLLLVGLARRAARGRGRDRAGS